MSACSGGAEALPDLRDHLELDRYLATLCPRDRLGDAEDELAIGLHFGRGLGLEGGNRRPEGLQRLGAHTLRGRGQAESRAVSLGDFVDRGGVAVIGLSIRPDVVQDDVAKPIDLARELFEGFGDRP